MHLSFIIMSIQLSVCPTHSVCCLLNCVVVLIFSATYLKQNYVRCIKYHAGVNWLIFQ